MELPVDLNPFAKLNRDFPAPNPPPALPSTEPSKLLSVCSILSLSSLIDIAVETYYCSGRLPEFDAGISRVTC